MQSLMVMVTQARTNKNVGCRNGERLRVQGATRATRGHKGHKWWMARFDWQHLLRLSCASAGWSDHSCGWLIGAVKVQLNVFLLFLHIFASYSVCHDAQVMRCLSSSKISYPRLCCWCAAQRGQKLMMVYLAILRKFMQVFGSLDFCYL